MASDNQLSLIGRATEPDMKFGASGVAYTRLAVGLYEGKNDDGTYKDSSWVDIVVFGDMAEHVAETIQKGDRIFVTGRITQDRWETDDGQKRSKLKVIADDIGKSLRWGPDTPTSTTDNQTKMQKAQKAAAAAARPKAHVAPDEAPF